MNSDLQFVTESIFQREVSMNDVDDKVASYIREELEKNPKVTNKDLMEGATKIDESLGELSLKQFHAKHRIPVVRNMRPSHERVLEYVQRRLKKNPDVPNSELFEWAKKIDPAFNKLSLLQFHAKYPLQVKRRLSAAKSAKAAPAKTPAKAAPVAKSPERTKKAAANGRRTRKAAAPAPASGSPASPSGDPEAIRAVLIDFARALSRAGSQAETIDVISNVDNFVARIMKS